MIGSVGFVGDRLTEALEARGVSATSLAQILELTPVAISQYAKGKTTPRPDMLRRICDVLNFPESFFRLRRSGRSDDSQEVFWRSFSSATKGARSQAARRFRWLKQIVEYLAGTLEFPAVNLPYFETPADLMALSGDDIEALAGRLRGHWGVGDGPISDLTLLLENNGVIVSRLTMGTESIDAFSQWSDSDKLPYIVLSSDKESAVRSRYNGGHELGHLMLHRTIENATIRTSSMHKAIEIQAYRFSSAFLLPERAFVDELWAPTLDAFRALKDRWKISIAAMIKRCAQLGIITEDQEKRLWINYNRRGWRLNEPLDDTLSMERPRLLRRSVELLITEGLKSKRGVLDELSLPARDIEELCALPSGFFSDQYETVFTMPKLRNDDRQPIAGPGVVVPFRQRQ
jgi:Zn-dependent peptidase ImmA (M78 family)/transcriptional regulator with XRE-family HTH domain